MAKKSSAQGGNVLFLILIAVALFAALSFVVTNSSRVSRPDTISQEEARLIAGQIMQFGVALRQAYMRLKLTGGCNEDEISFVAPTPVPGGGGALTPRADFTCHIFYPEGGGVPYPGRFKEWTDEPLPADAGQRGYFYLLSKATSEALNVSGEQPHKVVGVGNSNYNVQLALNFPKTSICQAFNTLVGIDGIPFDDDELAGDEATVLVGKDAFCREKTYPSNPTERHLQIRFVIDPR